MRTINASPFLIETHLIAINTGYDLQTFCAMQMTNGRHGIRLKLADIAENG